MFFFLHIQSVFKLEKSTPHTHTQEKFVEWLKAVLKYPPKNLINNYFDKISLSLEKDTSTVRDNQSIGKPMFHPFYLGLQKMWNL